MKQPTRVVPVIGQMHLVVGCAPFQKRDVTGAPCLEIVEPHEAAEGFIAQKHTPLGWKSLHDGMLTYEEACRMVGT